MNDRDSFTKRIPLLANCTLDDRASFERLVERRQARAGDVLLHEGKTDQALWLLLEGTVEVVKTAPDGHEEQLAVLDAGNVFGEMSFLSPAPHCASVRAKTDVTVGYLTPEAFQTLRNDSPRAAFCILTNLVELLSDRLRDMDERICQALSNGSAPRQSKEWHDFRARLFAGWNFE